MPSTPRDHARLERRLVATLTQACETAKAEIPGFDWLTHEVDPAAVANSLRVIWVFDTRANKDLALASGLDALMRELTALALDEADVEVAQLQRCVRFDSEEECRQQNAGDWPARLTRLHRAKG